MKKTLLGSLIFVAFYNLLFYPTVPGVGLGLLFLLDNFRVFEFVRVGRFWPLILIAAGLYMFRNKIGGQR